MRLPLEIVETIIAYLIHDLRSLHSCSLTCYSWYITAFPHLHCILITSDHPWNPKLRWSYPIQSMHALGLLPFVQSFLFCGPSSFSPHRFNYCILRQFSALTNVQTLSIYGLDIPNFIPRFRRYFGSFLPTVQDLCLEEPKGSNRQIIFFIGLFQHLKHLLLHDSKHWWRDPEEELELLPHFAPPLRGWLVVRNWANAHFFQDMVNLFEDIRFSTMDLYNVNETRFLLHTCVRTLQALRLYPTDPLGEQLQLRHA